MDVLIFCGLQAAGKSTFYREHFLSTHVLISKDLMPNTARPARRQAELLHLALQAQHSVVIDNTNPTLAERVPLIEIAHNYQARVTGYYFVASAQQALERNRQRTGKANIPAVAIYSTAAKLIPPTYAEGFDTLYYVHIAENSAATAPAWRIEEIAHEEQ
ncbi:MAG TPA: ATP-binding protein [Ktedonobacteraceae bacterium]